MVLERKKKTCWKAQCSAATSPPPFFALQSTPVRVCGLGKTEVMEMPSTPVWEMSRISRSVVSFSCNDCIHSYSYICDTWLHLEPHAAAVTCIDKIKCIDKRLFPGSPPAPSGESGGKSNRTGRISNKHSTFKMLLSQRASPNFWGSAIMIVVFQLFHSCSNGNTGSF